MRPTNDVRTITASHSAIAGAYPAARTASSTKEDRTQTGDQNTVSMAREWIAQHEWGQGASSAHSAEYVSYFQVLSFCFFESCQEPASNCLRWGVLPLGLKGQTCPHRRIRLASDRRCKALPWALRPNSTRFSRHASAPWIVSKQYKVSLIP